jgi:hypothetical protein
VRKSMNEYDVWVSESVGKELSYALLTFMAYCTLPRGDSPLFILYQCNVCLGKTAIAEGLAQRIVNGDVPHPLKGRKLVSLDLGALLAGTISTLVT